MSKQLWRWVWILAVLAGGACQAAAPRSSATEISEALLGAAIPASSVAPPARVLRLHSYHPEMAWVGQINAGIEAALQDSGYSVARGNLELDNFYMDTKRHIDRDYFAAVSEQAIAHIRRTQPDVIIVSDNNAVEWVIVPLAPEGAFDFVFVGWNGDLPDTLAENPHVTGVLERPHLQENLAWLSQIYPEARRITLLSDDSVTSRAYSRDVQHALEASAFAGSPFYVAETFMQWQQMVLRANTDSTALVVGTYHTLRTGQGPVHENTVLDWTIKHATIPVLGLWEFSLEQGVLGGYVVSGEVQGYAAGTLVARVLQGERPGDLPIRAPEDGKLLVNRAALNRWDVHIPPEALENVIYYTP